MPFSDVIEQTITHSSDPNTLYAHLAKLSDSELYGLTLLAEMGIRFERANIVMKRSEPGERTGMIQGLAEQVGLGLRLTNGRTIALASDYDLDSRFTG